MRVVLCFVLAVCAICVFRQRWLLPPRFARSSPLDCAGLKLRSIGRITEGLLLKIARTVDIVEPIAKFAEPLRGREGIGRIFNVGLEDWAPAAAAELRYDLIWNQWCLGHLTDAQLVVYLEKCAKVLNEGGLVVVKENLSTADEDVFDEIDSSVTR